MHEVVVTVFGVTGLLALVSLLPPLASRLNLPYTVLLAVVGCVLGAVVAASAPQVAGGELGPLGDFLGALHGFGISSEALLFIFLPTLLFESGLSIDVRRLMDDGGPILLLAVVAVLVCTFVVGYALSAVTEVGLVACLLLGSIVATTDPAAVVGIFRDIGAPRRLSILVEGESLFNDAAAIALFTVLAGLLVGGHQEGAGATVLHFLRSFAGGALAGFVAARAACALISLINGWRLAEITLTVSLAYLVFVVADVYLEVSGVVAVVVAALVMGSYGRTRVTPSTWDSLVETWEQLGFWANSLIFLMAALLVPQMLGHVGIEDLVPLVVLVVATLVARAMVVFGLVPALSGLRLAGRMSPQYKVVILWGGLRGAVSLALAIAVTENGALPEEVRHFVAVMTIGFVLFTLFVNGITLRPLIRVLGLDKLSPTEQAVRDRAVALALGDIKQRVETIAREDEFEPPIAAGAVDEIAARIGTITARRDGHALTDEDRIHIGLATLAAHEQELCFIGFKGRTIGRTIVHAALAHAGRLLDGAKTGGRAGYEAAMWGTLAFPRGFRLALWLQHQLGHERWLAKALGTRFEQLLIGEMLVRKLIDFNRHNLGALLGEETARTLGEILQTRLAGTQQALLALKLQYPDYARDLQARYLARVTWRLEAERYRTMLNESVISQEVYNDLMRRLGQRWKAIDQRPHLDVALQREAMVARVPIFAGLEESRLRHIARLMRPRLALPGERIVTAGERGDAMYFIASGAVEVRLSPQPIRLGSGDFFGEIALLAHRPRTADVVTLGFCRLLVLYARDVDALLGTDPALRQQIDEVARRRLAAATAAK
jgi:CPA1 family monovalent cation:H+ antiporter